MYMYFPLLLHSLLFLFLFILPFFLFISSLSSGHVDLIQTVCSRYTFDNQVKLIDRNTQTPLHYVLRAKHNERSIKVSMHN